MNVNVVFVLCMTALAAVVKGNPASPSPLIVGGVVANPGDIPWIVSLSASGNHFCGGSLLDKRTILTAAHCVEGFNAVSDELKARVGSLYHNKGGIQYSVTEIRVHQDYNAYNTINDVAILKVGTDMTVSGNINGIPVSTVKLPTGGELAAGTLVKVAGWGNYNANSQDISEKLKWVQLAIIDRGICTDANPVDQPITKEMICAGALGQDACQGDSGGPLTKGNVIYGIVSWGIAPCADYAYPGSAYSNVVALRDWITANRG